MKTDKINCAVHGIQDFGLLCTHLALSLRHREKIGFHEYDSGDSGRPDAWCDACEARWDLTKTDDDRDQWFIDCDHKLVCATCWDEAKELNQS